jgi:hypothetical protein
MFFGFQSFDFRLQESPKIYFVYTFFNNRVYGVTICMSLSNLSRKFSAAKSGRKRERKTVIKNFIFILLEDHKKAAELKLR